MMTHDEMIAVIQAHKAGKQIQIDYANKPSGWNDMVLAPEWNFRDMKYRAKPEPKLKPWKPEEVPVGALIQFRGSISVILAVYGQKLWFINQGELTWNYVDAGIFYASKYSTDGGKTWKPCGVEE